MKKKLLKNLGLKLLSVAIAVVVWFLVVMTNNPKDTRTFYDVPVRLVNVELLEAEGKVYQILDNTDLVRVTVEMPRNLMNELTKDDIVAEADVSKLTEINTIPISYSVINPDLNVTDIRGNRDVVRLSVEDEIKKWVNVKHNLVGEPAEGYIVDAVSMNLTGIQITGPKSVVENVDVAVAEADVSNAVSNVSVNVEPAFYDEEGNLLSLTNVQRNEDTVHLDVKILATRDVPLEAGYMGVPAEGYLANGEISIDPPTVKVAGTLSALMSVNKISIPQEEVDITGAAGNYEVTVNIRKYLPENVKLVDNVGSARVNVTVGVEPEEERILTIPQRNIQILSMPEGFEAVFDEGTAGLNRLTISGLNDAVSAIDQAAVTGVVDIAAWMEENEMSQLEAGVYQLPVSFEFPEDINVKDQMFIRLRIEEVEEEE